MKLLINSIDNESVLNSNNFARKSNLVYSEVISKKAFKLIDSKNITIISEDDKSIFYKRNKFTLQENNIIFCNSFTIEALFEELYKVNNLKNLKLITHQSDRLITKKLFQMKPNCISEWFSINVDNAVNGINPLPIGLSNEHFEKTLDHTYYSKFEHIDFKDKVNKLYVNFEVNTNFNQRYKLIKLFSKKPWAVVETNKLTLSKYLENLNKYKFVLCPWGNGIDTHRLWETLYAGSIPITKHHYTYSTTKGLPILTLNNYKNLTINDLRNFKIDEQNDQKLTTDYWLQEINKNKENSNQNIMITESKNKQINSVREYSNMLNNIRRIKKFKTLERKIKKRIF